MFSFNFSRLIAFLLLYVPLATIAQKKKAWQDPVPCKNFYDKGAKGTYHVPNERLDKYEAEWRGGTDCWCPEEEAYGSNKYWYHSGVWSAENSINHLKFLNLSTGFKDEILHKIG